MHTTALPLSATPPSLDPLLNLKQILGSTQHPGLLGIGRSTFYELIQTGVIPRPIKVRRRSLWRQSDIQRSIEWLARESQTEPRGLP